MGKTADSFKTFSTLEVFNENLDQSNKLTGVDFSYFQTKSDPNSGEFSSSDDLSLNITITDPELTSVDIYIFLQYKFTKKFNIEFTDYIKFSSSTGSGTNKNFLGYLDLEQDLYFDSA